MKAINEFKKQIELLDDSLKIESKRENYRTRINVRYSALKNTMYNDFLLSFIEDENGFIDFYTNGIGIFMDNSIGFNEIDDFINNLKKFKELTDEIIKIKNKINNEN